MLYKTITKDKKNSIWPQPFCSESLNFPLHFDISLFFFCLVIQAYWVFHHPKKRHPVSPGVILRDASLRVFEISPITDHTAHKDDRPFCGLLVFSIYRTISLECKPRLTQWDF